MVPDGLKGNTGELRNDSGRPQKTCIGGQEAGRRPEETRAGGEGAQATTGAEEITTGTEGERQSHHATPDFKGMTSGFLTVQKLTFNGNPMRAPRPPHEGGSVVISGLPRIYVNRQGWT